MAKHAMSVTCWQRELQDANSGGRLVAQNLGGEAREPLKIPFQGWGVFKGGGRIKLLPLWASEYTPHT